MYKLEHQIVVSLLTILTKTLLILIFSKLNNHL